MKIIKLNRRYRVHKDHGYQAGLRFNGHSQPTQEKIQAIESVCRGIFGNSGWFPATSDWTSYRAKPNGTRPCPYFIMFRRESDMTMILLKAQL
jgi:hypothetical protein